MVQQPCPSVVVLDLHVGHDLLRHLSIARRADTSSTRVIMVRTWTPLEMHLDACTAGTNARTVGERRGTVAGSNHSKPFRHTFLEHRERASLYT